MKNDNFKGTLIIYRLNEAYEVLEDAKKLAKSKGSPRSIINRAYYAMFYAILALLVTVDKGSAKHSGVISLFDRHFVKAGLISKEFSKAIHQAFELRQQGDYGEVTPIDRADAEELLKDAEKFIQSVRGYLIEIGMIPSGN